MTSNQSTHLQRLIDRLPDETAREELITCAYDRLRRLARKMLHTDFPRLADLHDTGSVVNQAAIRLHSSLEAIHPPSVRDFMRYSALQIRRVLLDMVRTERRRSKKLRLTRNDASMEPESHETDPIKFAMCAELFESIHRLPPREREIVDLYFIQGLTQKEIACLLGLHPKEVSRRWLTAARQLPDCLPD